MGKSILLWFIAIVVTLAAVVYQRTTGPTYPKRGSVEIAGQEVKYSLLTTHDDTGDAEMQIKAPAGTTGEVRWRRYKSNDQWQSEPLASEGNELIFHIPVQPAAGKVMYEVTLHDMAGNSYPLTTEPVVIRFKGHVPPYVLFPHIFCMFIAMLLSTRTGLEAVANGARSYKMALWTAAFLFVGGMILGPVMQKYAFGAFWTGWPFGHDLTDNKTFVALLFWVIAIWRTKPPRASRTWIIVAAVVTFAVYMIPHSVLGSEIDYTKQVQ